MENLQLKKLYNAIKSDNVKVFTSFMLQEKCFNLSFGRFPILSLLYMFKSYKILDKFERKLLPISSFKTVEEYGETYLKFKKLAKKSIRYFVAENQRIIYPIFVLAIQMDNDTIRKNYDIIYKNAEINEILCKIYANNRENSVKIAVNKFSSKQNKHSIKQKIFLGIVSVAMCLLMALPWVAVSFVGGSTGLGTGSSPIKVGSEKEFVLALEKGSKNYILTNDIELSNEINVSSFSGKLDGNDHSVKISENQSKPLIENLSGIISNISFEVNISDINLTNDFAIIANQNSGTIQNSDVSGEISAQINGTDDMYVSIFSVQNSGTISSCVSSTNIVVNNASDKNAFVSVFAGKNNGTISDSETAKGIILADTIDAAGIAAENNGKIINSINRLDISQTSSKLWHPNTAGIVLNNNGEISGAKNYGNISCISLNEEQDSEQNKNGFALYAAGIACNSINTIEASRNYGDIVAKAKTATIYAGGIVAMNAISDDTMGTISDCKSFCNIIAENLDIEREVFVGGLCGASNTNISGSGFEGKISLKSAGRADAGGLVGAHYQGVFNKYITAIMNCYSAATFSVENNNSEVYLGKIVGTCTTGEGVPLIYISINNYYVSGSENPMYHIIQYDEDTQSAPAGVNSSECGTRYFSTLEELKRNAIGVKFDD